MSKKTLEERLAKKTQQIIENADCPKCGEKIHYILRGANNAVGEPWYTRVETELTDVINQNGSLNSGYKIHKCKRERE